MSQMMFQFSQYINNLLDRINFHQNIHYILGKLKHHLGHQDMIQLINFLNMEENLITMEVGN